MPAIRPRVRFAAFLLLCGAGACASSRPVDSTTRKAVTAEIESTIKAATDLSTPGVPDRMMSLYSRTGHVVSASGGRVITSRDSLAAGINWFWNNVGVNMRNPQWIWGQMDVDVLSPDAAVLTATYTIPHLNPHNHLHIIGGAWTAVFQKQGGRWVIIQEHLSDAPAIGGDSMPMPMPTTADTGAGHAAGRVGRPPR
jgi:hypothetical protein